MNSEQDFNIQSSGQYAEDYPPKNGRRKNNRHHSVIWVLACFVAFMAGICVAVVLTDRIDFNKDNENNLPVSAEVALPDEREVVLTRDELDAMLEGAAAQAIAEAETDREQAVESARAEILNGIMTGLATGDETTVEVLRPFYPDYIVAVSNGSFHFVPINRELKLNSYSDENLNILESGEYQYMDGANVISHKGIDVSRFQGNIDWNAVAQDGVEFAFIRVANRGYGSGKLVEDEKFEANLEGALAAGIHVGVYVFSQAITEEEVLEEAGLVMDKLAPYNVKCPIVIDVEKTLDSSGRPTGRMNDLSVEERTNLTLLFCQTIEQAGYKPMIYHNLEMGAVLIDIETLEGYDKWFAYYNDDMYYPYEYKIWQYSDKGSVNGIGSDVDLNISFSAFWEE